MRQCPRRRKGRKDFSQKTGAVRERAFQARTARTAPVFLLKVFGILAAPAEFAGMALRALAGPSASANIA